MLLFGSAPRPPASLIIFCFMAEEKSGPSSCSDSSSYTLPAESFAGAVPGFCQVVTFVSCEGRSAEVRVRQGSSWCPAGDVREPTRACVRACVHSLAAHLVPIVGAALIIRGGGPALRQPIRLRLCSRLRRDLEDDGPAAQQHAANSGHRARRQHQRTASGHEHGREQDELHVLDPI